MKMYDMGTMIDMPSTAMCLRSSNIPEVEGLNVGDMVNLSSQGRVIEKEEDEDGDIKIRVEVVKSGFSKGQAMSKEEYMKLTDEEKDIADAKEVLGEED